MSWYKNLFIILFHITILTSIAQILERHENRVRIKFGG